MTLRSRAAALLAALALAPLPAAAKDGAVTGSARYLQRIALPPTAVFTAVLLDSSRQDVAAIELGKTVKDPAGHPPYLFEIRYDPAGIKASHTYTVRATITDKGRLLFTSDTAHPVLTRGAGNSVDIVMKMTGKSNTDTASAAPSRFHGLFRYRADAALFQECRTGQTFPVAMEQDFQRLQRAYRNAAAEPGAPALTSVSATVEPRPKMDGAGTEPTLIVHRVDAVSAEQECQPPIPDAALTNTYWRLSELDGKRVGDVPGNREPHILLESGRPRYRATAGCNGLGGEYVLAGDKLTFKPGISTMMACPPPVDAYERGLRQALTDTVGWQVDGVILSLLGAEGEVLARLRAVYLQ